MAAAVTFQPFTHSPHRTNVLSINLGRLYSRHTHVATIAIFLGGYRTRRYIYLICTAIPPKLCVRLYRDASFSILFLALLECLTSTQTSPSSGRCSKWRQNSCQNSSIAVSHMTIPRQGEAGTIHRSFNTFSPLDSAHDDYFKYHYFPQQQHSVITAHLARPAQPGCERYQPSFP
jgi:hypothetical protein